MALVKAVLLITVEDHSAVRAPGHTFAKIASILLISFCSSPVIADPLALSADQERALKAGSSFKECKACPEMMVVPAGQFLMGAEPNERVPFATPQHEVRIVSRFAVSRTEITVDEYAAFVRDTGRVTRPGCQTAADTLNGIVKPRETLSWRNPGFSQQGSSPVTCVTWHDAKAYVEWLARVTGKPYVCCPNPSGNMPHAAARRPPIISAAPSTICAATPTARTEHCWKHRSGSDYPPRTSICPAAMAMRILPSLGALRPIVSAFTTCTAMSPNGWRIVPS